MVGWNLGYAFALQFQSSAWLSVALSRREVGVLLSRRQISHGLFLFLNYRIDIYQCVGRVWRRCTALPRFIHYKPSKLRASVKCQMSTIKADQTLWHCSRWFAPLAFCRPSTPPVPFGSMPCQVVRYRNHFTTTHPQVGSLARVSKRSTAHRRLIQML